MKGKGRQSVGAVLTDFQCRQSAQLSRAAWNSWVLGCPRDWEDRIFLSSCRVVVLGKSSCVWGLLLEHIYPEHFVFC